jgi:dsRNA-specific ribonuclease
LQFSQSPREALPTQSVQQTQNQGQTSIGCYRSPIVWSKNAAKAILRDFCVKCVVPPVVPGLSNKFEISLNWMTEYTTTETGLAHQKAFQSTVEFVVNGIKISAVGKVTCLNRFGANWKQGSKKKDSEKSAAIDACTQLHKLSLLDIQQFSENDNMIVEQTSTQQQQVFTASGWSKNHSKGIYQHTYQVTEIDYSHANHLLQKYTRDLPVYEVHGPDSDGVFTATVKLPVPDENGTFLSFTGTAKTKKEAETEAAFQACCKLESMDKLLVPKTYLEKELQSLSTGKRKRYEFLCLISTKLLLQNYCETT